MQPQCISDNMLVPLIFCGFGHSFAITQDGDSYGWGWNSHGELGIGPGTDQTAPIPVVPLTGEQFIHYFNGFSFSIGLTKNGMTYSWGRNRCGQLGIGNFDDQANPVKLLAPDGGKFSHISCGVSHSIGFTDKGNVFSWGWNNFGQLGLGNTSDQCFPQPLFAPFGKFRFHTIWIGASHCLGLTEEKSAFVWGWNELGQLGLGDTKNRPHPELIVSPNSQFWVRFAAGIGHSAGITENDECFVWGHNQFGQLGLGDFENRFTPHLLRSPHGKLIRIYCGGFHTFGICQDFMVFAWGYNSFGQLGLGNRENQCFPQLLRAPNGEHFSCFITGCSFSYGITYPSAQLFAWGQNTRGELGLGHTSEQIAPQIWGMIRPKLVKSHPHYDQLKEDLQLLLNSGLCADARVQIQGKEIRFHRALIGILCPQLLNALSNGDLASASPEAVEMLLQYFYETASSKVDITPKLLKEVSDLSRKYQLRDLEIRTKFALDTLNASQQTKRLKWSSA